MDVTRHYTSARLQRPSYTYYNIVSMNIKKTKTANGPVRRRRRRRRLFFYDSTILASSFQNKIFFFLVEVQLPRLSLLC